MTAPLSPLTPDDFDAFCADVDAEAEEARRGGFVSGDVLAKGGVKLRQILAALALAAIAAASVAGCQNPVQAPVPAPPSCPSGEHWAETGGQQQAWGCVK